MVWSGQHDAQVGWTVRRIFQIILALIAIANWIPILFQLPIVMNSFWDWMPWTPQILLLSGAITFSSAFLISLFPTIKRAFAYPKKAIQERADEIEREEIQRRENVVTIIERLIALSQGSLSPEELSLIEICEEELQKISLLPEDKSANQVGGLKVYLELIKPYVQAYGIDRAREEGRKWLNPK